MTTACAVLSASMLHAALAVAQTPMPSPAPSPVPCTAAAHRQFDFWIGEWEVRNPKGTIAGRNRIESILNGCALHESWTGTSGVKGQSFNTYDPATRRWHQLWIDDTGTVLHLAGGIENGRMVLEGVLPSTQKPGTQVRQRITWERQPEGKLRQLWETSTDGKSWSVEFDGWYSRAASEPTAKTP